MAFLALSYRALQTWVWGGMACRRYAHFLNSSQPPPFGVPNLCLSSASTHMQEHIGQHTLCSYLGMYRCTSVFQEHKHMSIFWPACIHTTLGSLAHSKPHQHERGMNTGERKVYEVRREGQVGTCGQRCAEAIGEEWKHVINKEEIDGWHWQMSKGQNASDQGQGGREGGREGERERERERERKRKRERKREKEIEREVEGERDR